MPVSTLFAVAVVSTLFGIVAVRAGPKRLEPVARTLKELMERTKPTETAFRLFLDSLGSRSLDCLVLTEDDNLFRPDAMKVVHVPSRYGGSTISICDQKTGRERMTYVLPSHPKGTIRLLLPR